jgi:hypothetical protein
MDLLAVPTTAAWQVFRRKRDCVADILAVGDQPGNPHAATEPTDGSPSNGSKTVSMRSSD